MSDATLDIDVALKGAEAALATLRQIKTTGEDAVSGVEGRAKSTEVSIGSLARQIAGYTSAADLAVQAGRKVVEIAVDLGKQSIITAASFETSRMKYGILLGDMAKGEKMFKDLFDFAATTPLQFDTIDQAAKMLLGYGVVAEDIIPSLRQLGDVASGNGDALIGLSRAYGQTLAQGKAQAQDLYQFINQGVPLIAQLAKIKGIDSTQVLTWMKSGDVIITFDDIKQALDNLTTSGGQYNDMMDKVATTTEGKWSTAMDNFKATLGRAGEGVLPALNKLLDELNSKMDRAAKAAESIKIMNVGLNIPSLVSKGDTAGVSSFFGSLSGLSPEEVRQWVERAMLENPLPTQKQSSALSAAIAGAADYEFKSDKNKPVPRYSPADSQKSKNWEYLTGIEYTEKDDIDIDGYLRKNATNQAAIRIMIERMLNTGLWDEKSPDIIKMRAFLKNGRISFNFTEPEKIEYSAPALFRAGYFGGGDNNEKYNADPNAFIGPEMRRMGFPDRFYEDYDGGLDYVEEEENLFDDYGRSTLTEQEQAYANKMEDMYYADRENKLQKTMDGLYWEKLYGQMDHMSDDGEDINIHRKNYAEIDKNIAKPFATPFYEIPKSDEYYWGLGRDGGLGINADIKSKSSPTATQSQIENILNNEALTEGMNDEEATAYLNRRIAEIEAEGLIPSPMEAFKKKKIDGILGNERLTEGMDDTEADAYINKLIAEIEAGPAMGTNPRPRASRGMGAATARGYSSAGSGSPIPGDSKPIDQTMKIYESAVSTMLADQVKLQVAITATSAISSTFESIGAAIASGGEGFDKIGTSLEKLGVQLIQTASQYAIAAGMKMIFETPYGLSGRGWALVGMGAAGMIGAGALNTQIPAYANGTPYHPGGVALVGERGPELVNLPTGSSVSPAGTFGSSINVQVINATRAKVSATVEESDGPSGKEYRVVLKEAMAGMVASGQLDKAIASRYGMRAQARRVN